MNSINAFTSTGNALLFKQSRFQLEPAWTDLRQSTGNHAVLGVALDSQSNQYIRGISVHFDSDIPDNRLLEFKEVLTHLTPQSNIIDLLLGDFNAPVEKSNIAVPYQQSRLRDTMLTLSELIGRTLPSDGRVLNEYTCPNTCRWCKNSIYGSIDHILFDPAQLTPDLDLAIGDGWYGFPGETHCGVLDHGLWTTYPHVIGKDRFELDRINTTLNLNGSDHFSVVATLWLV
jgi:hypothetical protein